MRALSCLVVLLGGCATSQGPDASLTGCDFSGAWPVSASARAAAPSCGDAGSSQSWSMTFAADGGLIIDDGAMTLDGTWVVAQVVSLSADGGALDGGFLPRFWARGLAAGSTHFVDAGFTTCDDFAGSREAMTSTDAGCSGYWHVSATR
ncbi:MAG: hypothetical protein Q8L48_37150 [Archangium sp.]|nr:hypothetical protein [Archangium sp.]